MMIVIGREIEERKKIKERKGKGFT